MFAVPGAPNVKVVPYYYQRDHRTHNYLTRIHVSIEEIVSMYALYSIPLTIVEEELSTHMHWYLHRIPLVSLMELMALQHPTLSATLTLSLVAAVAQLPSQSLHVVVGYAVTCLTSLLHPVPPLLTSQ